MKTVVIEIELEIDETQDSNSGIAAGIELTLMHNEYGKPNYVVCRNKHRYTSNVSAAKPPTIPNQTGS